MRQITISDLCELTGYSRDQMRGMLAALPRFARRYAEARVASVYSNHDVVLVVLLCRLETVYGLKRSAVAALCEPIAATLAAPRKVSKDACLVLRVQNATCEYIDTAPLINDGLIVALGSIFLSIDSYLLPTPLVQRDVGLSATGTLRNLGKTRTVGRQGNATRESVPHERQRNRSNNG